MKIYLDTCCYRRPFDDQSESKIRRESKAIGNIIAMCRKNSYTIVGSEALLFEIKRIRNAKKRAKVLNFYNITAKEGDTDAPAGEERVKALAVQCGVQGLDVDHLALAEALNADFLITTDEDFVEACLNMGLNVKVVNPRDFLRKRYDMDRTSGTIEVREKMVVAEPDMNTDFDAWLDWLINDYDEGEGDCVKEKYEDPITEDELKVYRLVCEIKCAYANIYNQNGGNYATDGHARLDTGALYDMSEEVVKMGVEGTVEFLRNDPKGKTFRTLKPQNTEVKH